MTTPSIPLTIFQASEHDIDAVSNAHSFKYANNIRNPEGLGITANAADISSNIIKLAKYDDILMRGKDSGALGSKYFAPTGGKCKDSSNNIVNRSLYINSVRPAETSDGNQGLIPSIITDLQEINPYKLYIALSSLTMPQCSLIEMNTTSSVSGIETAQRGYVADSEISNMNACWFPNKTNPLNATKKCTESFSNISADMPNDTFIKAYFFSLGILGFYILTKMVTKKS